MDRAFVCWQNVWRRADLRASGGIEEVPYCVCLGLSLGCFSKEAKPLVENDLFLRI